MTQDIKVTLWKAADKLRAQMDAAEYKHIILGLIFLKYISDTFLKQQEKVKKMVSDPSSEYFISQNPEEYLKELEERDYYTQDNVFWVPQDSRWETLRSKAKQPDIGSLVDGAMTSIENENPTLRGKLDKRFGRAQMGQERTCKDEPITEAAYESRLVEEVVDLSAGVRGNFVKRCSQDALLKNMFNNL